MVEFSPMPRWMRTLAIVLSVLAAVYLISLVPRPSTKPKTPAVPKEITLFSSPRTFRSHWKTRTADGGSRPPSMFPPTKDMVVNFLAALRSLTLEEVLSRRAENHGLFKVDEKIWCSLAVWTPGAKEPLTVVIGKDSPSGGHVYAANRSSPDVCLATGSSRSQAEAGLKIWRDARVVPLAADAVIQSVRVRGAQGTLFVERSSDTWTINGKPADRGVEQWTTNLRYLSADTFTDPPELLGPISLGLASPAAEITLTLDSGRPMFLLGKPEKGDAPRVLIRLGTRTRT